MTSSLALSLIMRVWMTEQHYSCQSFVRDLMWGVVLFSRMSTGLLRSAMDHSVPEVWGPGRGLYNCLDVYNTQIFLLLSLSLSLFPYSYLDLSFSLILSLSLCFHTKSPPASQSSLTPFLILNIILRCLFSILRMFRIFFTFSTFSSSLLTFVLFYMLTS